MSDDTRRDEPNLDIAGDHDPDRYLLSGLTDMSGTEYDIDEAKAEYRAKRRERLPALRREGRYDEDGNEVEVALDWDTLKRLLRYLKPYRKHLVFAVVLLLSYSAIVPAFPSLIGRAVDNFIVADRAPFTGLTIDERLAGLLRIVLIYMGLRVLNFGLRFGYTYLVSWLGQHVIYDIRKEVFGKIQRLHMGFFDRTPVGRLITRITSDVDAIQRMMTDGVVGLIADVGLIAGLTIYMFSINWQLNWHMIRRHKL